MAKKEAEKEKPTIPNREISFESTQKVILDDNELRVKGAELADAIDEKNRAEAEFNDIKQQFKARIDGAVCRAAGLASTIRAKFEYRNVKCSRVFDFNRGLVIEWRNDTTERIGERTMTDKDREQYLPLEMK
jgi:hypothetical protein